jgi:dihydrofolate reductase
MEITIIVAIAEEWAIGHQNDLLAYIPGDLKRFKQLTTGHAIVMGRKTFESLPNGALPNRKNIVITRQPGFTANNIEVVHSLNEAIEIGRQNNDTEIFIIGGAEIYRQFLPLATRLQITWIHHRFEIADTFFPRFDANEWELTTEQKVTDDPKTPFQYTFATYQRK